MLPLLFAPKRRTGHALPAIVVVLDAETVVAATTLVAAIVDRVDANVLALVDDVVTFVTEVTVVTEANVVAVETFASVVVDAEIVVPTEEDEDTAADDVVDVLAETVTLSVEAVD